MWNSHLMSKKPLEVLSYAFSPLPMLNTVPIQNLFKLDLNSELKENSCLDKTFLSASRQFKPLGNRIPWSSWNFLQRRASFPLSEFALDKKQKCWGINRNCTRSHLKRSRNPWRTVAPMFVNWYFSFQSSEQLELLPPSIKLFKPQEPLMSPNSPTNI